MPFKKIARASVFDDLTIKSDVDVYMDGELLARCVEADAEAGWADVWLPALEIDLPNPKPAPSDAERARERLSSNRVYGGNLVQRRWGRVEIWHLEDQA